MSNPKIRCDVCHRLVSQYHLARHRGTFDCVRAHYVDVERRKHAVPSGLAVVTYRQEAFLWWAFDKAGFDVVDCPLTMQTYWWGNNSDGPSFGTTAPIWAAQVSRAIENQKDRQAMDVVVLAEHLHRTEAQERVDARNALSTEIELSCYDESHYLIPAKVRRVVRRWASEAMGGACPDS